MRLSYLRFDAFDRLKRAGAPGARMRRMKAFLEMAQVKPGQRILDLGGTPSIWQDVSVPLHITLLNLPGSAERADHGQHHFTYIDGDACHADQLGDGQFDVVFSNSVIEHVGPPDRQLLFAREVIRLGRSYWIQTPSIWFPIEAHCGMPFWWFYPEPLKQAFIQRWRRKLPNWTEMVAGTRVLTRNRIKELFPDCSIYTEYVFGLPKSYTAFRLESHVDGSAR